MKPTFLELRHLRTLLALKETGSVSMAAKRVYLTQSALSHQIKLMEEQFGLPLFERKSNPLRFTAAGDRLIRLANEILPKVVDAERELARVKHGDAGQLRIAVECHTCFDWLMPAMDEFRQHWGLVELDIVSGFHTDPVGLLLSHRADWAIVSDVEQNDDVVFKPLNVAVDRSFTDGLEVRQKGLPEELRKGGLSFIAIPLCYRVDAFCQHRLVLAGNGPGLAHINIAESSQSDAALLALEGIAQ